MNLGQLPVANQRVVHSAAPPLFATLVHWYTISWYNGVHNAQQQLDQRCRKHKYLLSVLTKLKCPTIQPPPPGKYKILHTDYARQRSIHGAAGCPLNAEPVQRFHHLYVYHHFTKFPVIL